MKCNIEVQHVCLKSYGREKSWYPTFFLVQRVTFKDAYFVWEINPIPLSQIAFLIE